MTIYRECKAFGHNYDRNAPAPPNARRAPTGWQQAHFRCIECGMYRRVRVNMTTGQTRNYYVRPADYTDKTHMPRRVWKIEWMLHRTKPKRKAKKK